MFWLTKLCQKVYLIIIQFVKLWCKRTNLNLSGNPWWLSTAKNKHFQCLQFSSFALKNSSKCSTTAAMVFPLRPSHKVPSSNHFLISSSLFSRLFFERRHIAAPDNQGEKRECLVILEKVNLNHGLLFSLATDAEVSICESLLTSWTRLIS